MQWDSMRYTVKSFSEQQRESTQQDGKEEEDGKHLCMTNVTRLLLAHFVVIFIVFWSFTKRSV